MRAKIESAFPICATNHCIVETTANPILIQDPNAGKCTIVNSVADAHFTINNTGKNILFIAIDQCIWGHDSGHKKCDFAVTDSAKFAFVEIKDTTNETPKHRSKAILQLEESIIRFRNLIDFTGINCYAIVAFRWIPLKPAASTSAQSSTLHFWNTYQVNLLEGNEMSF